MMDAELEELWGHLNSRDRLRLAAKLAQWVGQLRGAAGAVRDGNQAQPSAAFLFAAFAGDKRLN